MRLLKTGPYPPGKKRLEMIQAWAEDVPPYAILSHTWSKDPDQEVLLEDILNGTSATKPAFAKLKTAVEKAMLDGYGYLWIDTCCIDKSSSVEMSEAINSMYLYYEHAEICYAFLSDVNADGPEHQDELARSRWWRRGWTLQELLAPRSVEFYSANWKPLGTKASLCNIIARFTGIDTEYLKGSLPAQHASIAKRMSWASARQTTREEDLAYCLIGIFEVNMTMLYGEGGKRAFLRLQEEIMRANEDQTLFAWIKDDGIPEDASGYHGLLADSPSDFARTGNSVAYSEHSDVTPSSMTARGLHATLPLYQKDDGTAIAALWCPVPQRGYNDWLAIYLERLPIGTNQYARVACKRLASVAELGSNQEVYVRQHFPRYALQTVYPYHFFQLDRLRSSSSYAKLGEYQLVDADKLSNAADSGNVHVQAVQPRQWCLPKVPRVYTIKKQAGALAAAIRVLRLHDNEAFILMLGSSSEFEVGFDVDEEALPSKTFQNLRLGFNPRPAGTVMKLKYHTVQVTVQEHVRGGNKFYSIDVDIQAFPKPSTFTEVIQDVVEYVAQPTGPEKTENRAAIKDELKRPWRAFWRRASGQR